MSNWLRILFFAVACAAVGTAWHTGPSTARADTVTQSPLTAFARRIGLRETQQFADTVGALRETGKLPARYVTKEDARAHGWRGGGLCSILPGAVIGGDVFHNFDGALPRRPTGYYHEADLDSTCKGRGARRLVYDKDRKIYVTVDHYQSFVPVP